VGDNSGPAAASQRLLLGVSLRLRLGLGLGLRLRVRVRVRARVRVRVRVRVRARARARARVPAIGRGHRRCATRWWLRRRWLCGHPAGQAHGQARRAPAAARVLAPAVACAVERRAHCLDELRLARLELGVGEVAKEGRLVCEHLQRGAHLVRLRLRLRLRLRVGVRVRVGVGVRVRVRVSGSYENSELRGAHLRLHGGRRVAEQGE